MYRKILLFIINLLSLFIIPVNIVYAKISAPVEVSRGVISVDKTVSNLASCLVATAEFSGATSTAVIIPARIGRVLIIEKITVHSLDTVNKGVITFFWEDGVSVVYKAYMGVAPCAFGDYMHVSRVGGGLRVTTNSAVFIQIHYRQE